MKIRFKLLFVLMFNFFNFFILFMKQIEETILI